MMLSSYSKIWNLGHPAVSNLFNDVVVVQEKVDGSQFSFGVHKGELRCRSKGHEIVIDAPEAMFKQAVDTVLKLAPELHPEWTYRAEYVRKPRHNALTYDRTPEGFIVLFDIDTGTNNYLSYDRLVVEGERLGLEVVPIFFEGMVTCPEELFQLLEKDSFLGGTKVEGIVIKNYTRFDRDGKTLMGKYVSEAFKEVQQKHWKKDNPSNTDIIRQLIIRYKTDARWEKAVQHLEEAGKLEHEPRDIGKLIKEIQKDILEECEEDIKDFVFKWAWPKINRGVAAGAAEWYKKKLAERQFE